MRKFHIFIFFISVQLLAQQDSYLSLVQFQMPLINPAYAGAEGDQLFSIHSRSQWANMDMSPRTLSMVYSVARKKNVGLGLSVVSDELFIEKQTLVALDFSYKLKLSNDSKLYLGLKGNINSFSADASGLIAYSTAEDPAKRNLSRVTPNIGIGVLYIHKQYWFSLSSPRLFQSKRDAEINVLAQNRIHFYLGAGAQFKLNETVFLEPQVLLRSTQGMPLVAEGIVWGNYKEKVRLGLGFRSSSVRSFKFNVNVNKTIALSYAYDVYRNDILSGMQLNAHEIGIRIGLMSKQQLEELIEVDPNPVDDVIN